ncbi:hypothetical protein DUI87_04419 [Hirundo rustica rustica]|uniref:Uncharacterized protein n=1 Tax=Hirundo rustica rustica TaxID=333673 RepID=A0A3M0KZ46_HIRRU|nr:hypothetical protein DUI87_04419 [Hirundo rustica rustica]
MQWRMIRVKILTYGDGTKKKRSSFDSLMGLFFSDGFEDAGKTEKKMENLGDKDFEVREVSWEQTITRLEYQEEFWVLDSVLVEE